MPEIFLHIWKLRTVDNEVGHPPAGAGGMTDDVSSLPFHTMEGLEPRAPLGDVSKGVCTWAPTSGADRGLAAVALQGSSGLVVASFFTGGKPPSRVVREGTSPH